MDTATSILLAMGLLVAWMIGPIMVLRYRIVVVPKRYEEIRDRFVGNDPEGLRATPDDRSRSGAWHYARLLSPGTKPEDPEKTLKQQFWHFHGWNRYRLPLAAVVVLSGLMLAFSGLWIAQKLCPPPSTPIGTALARIEPVFPMALWGAYVWSLYEILSRRKSGDLTPVELWEIASRYVTAIPVGYAFSLLIDLSSAQPLAAFAVSAFPLRDIRQFFRAYSLSKLDRKSETASSADSRGYLSDTLCGVGNATIARLEELNIESYMDLAYADPVKLMIKTGAPIELVLAWIDQAMLSVYAAPHKAALASYGMPCALDMCEFYARHCWDVVGGTSKPWEINAAVLALAHKLEIPAVILVEQILRNVFEDPHTQFLVRVWHGPATSETTL
ncbi:MAG TPA: hypothetical protein VII72_06160 [Myxococcota bacterium]|jgi:hypothetical protein